MAKKVLMKGNEAIAEAAVRAGCRLFFGYPITPSSELIEYLADRLPEVGGVFLQAESEVAAINMVYGAAGAGQRAMTGSSSPGISLKQEGLSYLAGAELPCVVVNIVRAGPGLGGLGPAQGDYFQATKGGGHGDYRVITLAPASVQEAADLTILAFDLADRYSNPAMILGDGVIGQMMEPVAFHALAAPGQAYPKPWATTGCRGRKKNKISCYALTSELLEAANLALQAKYAEIREKEQRWESYRDEDAELLLVSFGTPARICKEVVAEGRKRGLRLGLIRPISLWPFPDKAFEVLSESVRTVLVVELNAGQMVEDVRLTVNARVPVHFYGRLGGLTPSVPELLAEAEKRLAAAAAPTVAGCGVPVVAGLPKGGAA